jgi:AcrR family transcriptional regulator
MAAHARRQRLTQDDWLAKALEVLGEKGVSGVCVEPLADALGVTKGSFYWHFEDRDELLVRLLEFWEDQYTNGLAAHVAELSGNPAGQLLNLLETIVREDPNRYDAAVRAWAQHDERAAAHLARVDQKRLDYVRDLFVKMGFSAKESDMRSRLSYYYLVGEYSVLAEPSSNGRRMECVRLRHRMLTAR